MEILGTAVGIVYLWLEYKASAWLWVASIVMPAIYIFVYYDAGLYADFAINIYYIIASVYGLVCWLRTRPRESGLSSTRQARDINREGGLSPTRQESSSDRSGEAQKPIDDKISHTPASLYLPLACLCGAIFLVIGFVLSRFTDSTVPWWDAFTTALSIVALWMLARKYIEQWLVWIVVDVACAVLYAYKGLWFTGALYLAYAIVAIFGYRKWKLISREE